MKSIRRYFWVGLSAFLSVLLLTNLVFHRNAEEMAEAPHCTQGSSLKWATGFPFGNDMRVVDIGCVDDSGRRHGTALRLVEGKPLSLSHFSHDVLHGSAVVWGSTGQIEMITHSIDGEPSRTLALDAEGRPTSMVRIDPQLGRASHVTWRPDGSQRSLYYTTVDEDSGLPTARLVGAYSVRDPEGALLVQGRYEDGARTGLWRCRSSSDEDFAQATFPGEAGESILVECLERVLKTKVAGPSSPTVASANPN